MDDQPDLGRESRAEQSEGASPSNETRSQRRAREWAEVRAKAERDGTVEQMFPTASPAVSRTLAEAALEGIVMPPEWSEPTVEATLPTLAFQINHHYIRFRQALGRASDERLQACLKFAEARRICDERKLNFREWSIANLIDENGEPLAYETVRRETRIGLDPDPVARIAEEREKTKAATRAYRERQGQAVNALRERVESFEKPIDIYSEPPETEVLDASTDESQGVSPASTTQELPVLATPSTAASKDPDALARWFANHIEQVKDVHVLRELAMVSAAALPPTQRIEHVDHFAKETHIKVTRGKGFIPTLDTLRNDFSMLSDEDKTIFALNLQSLMEPQNMDHDEHQHGDD